MYWLKEARLNGGAPFVDLFFPQLRTPIPRLPACLPPIHELES